MNQVEIARARQRFRHRGLRDCRGRKILDVGDADAGRLLEFLHRRLHRCEVVRPHDRLEVGFADLFGRSDNLLALIRREHRAPERSRRQGRQPEAALEYPPPRKPLMGHNLLPFAAACYRRSAKPRALPTVILWRPGYSLARLALSIARGLGKWPRGAAAGA